MRSLRQKELIRSTEFGRIFRLLVLAAFAAVPLSACTEIKGKDSAPTLEAPAPLPRPNIEADQQQKLRHARAARERAANDAARAALRTPASQNMTEYLHGVERSLLARGRLRTDDGTNTGPITPEQLTENFIQIALRDEYVRRDGLLVAQSQAAPLRRWTTPVRMYVDYGASISPAKRSRISADVRDYAGRLQRASGHPVSFATQGGNFTVMVLSEDERRLGAPRMELRVPGIPAADVQALVNLTPENYCTVFAYSRDGGATYVRALALIRSELPDRLLLSCIHEELAQGLGLANDSPSARPSIFNDDEEFALLTRHDELLLKILYDPRLQPGMTETEARPIVNQIAHELLASPGEA